jgi:indolepyruvate ferredoxin oxidoreductase, beta subunit
VSEASELISSALMKSGFDVKQSEVHGMAQRGGSVISHIRFGEKVYSPLIESGKADFAASFELLESLRYLPYFNKETKLIVNTQRILPSPVSTGIDTYPPDVLDQLKVRSLTVFPFDAFEAAKAAGEARAANVVITGALSVFLPVEEKVFIEVLVKRLPEKIRKVNTEAFLKGRELIKGGK